MATKIDKDTYPERAKPEDFKCFGPPATKDGEFDTVKICDMGCFTQDGKDSNKYYHAAVVQHKKSKNWYTYFEWGRTGATHPSFQFVACASEAEAGQEFADQLHSKNDKRGQWITVAGLRTLRAKKGKDCYLVRPMATRSTGLPDARRIKINEGGKKKPAPKDGKSKTPRSALKVDQRTLSLMRDLNIATLDYTRGSMADASLPTQQAIDEARAILTEAQKRLLVVGNDVDDQVKDKELKQLTSVMYGRIPKKKPLNAAPETWILSKDNIFAWQHDLDAFESALYATDVGKAAAVDPFSGMALTMEWLPPTSELGKFLYGWWPHATRNRHAGVGNLKIKNLWIIDRHADKGKLTSVQDELLKSKLKVGDRPQFQPKVRADLDSAESKRYRATNTALLFHGTRSVNVSGILRESLRLPKQLVGVSITGAMFGPGLYFADDWKKSSGYTSLHGSYWSSGGGAIKGRAAFMFAVDVVLGNPYVAPHAKGFAGPPRGHHCVFGKAGKSGVINNEFIVFKPQQHQLKYLIEFSTGR
jgi:hypothetical protein